MISSSICKVLLFASLAIEIHSVSINIMNSYRGYPEKTFRCNNGKYIFNNYFCRINMANAYAYHFSNFYRGISNTDSSMYCDDQSDASYGCDDENCGIGKFKCNNGTCLDINSRCNTIKECSDGSDEFNCGDEVNVGNCSLADGKFLCHDKKRCLDLEYTCDKECNCFDCSDENENCSTYYLKKYEECPHYYFDTPDGAKCLCDSNDPETKNLCKEIKPCTQPNSCNQRCLQYRNKMACSCYDNYFMEAPGDYGFLCKNKVYYDNLLAYSTSNQIKIVNLTSAEIVFIKKKTQAGAITGAYDHLYYTTYDDSDRKTIYKTSITTGMTTGVIQSNSSIVSIAVDYITTNIYFTTNTSLSVCSNDGKICTELKCCNVRYVVLAPKTGLMFYMKKAEFQDEKYIMKSAMDGSDEDYFVDGGFRHFSALTVDESTRKLYWSQSDENEFWSLSFDGGHRELRTIKYQGTLVSGTVLDSELFFTKLRDYEIYRIQNIERYTKHIKSSNYDGFYTNLNSGTFAQRSSVSVHKHITSDVPSLSKPALAAFVSSIPNKRNILPFEHHNLLSDLDAPVVSGIPLETVSSITDNNATRLIDSNVTFAIKYLYAFNPRLQGFSKNPCVKSSCDGLCLLRPPASANDSNYVCICENLSSTSGQNWCNSRSSSSLRNNPTVAEYSTNVRENEAYLLKKQPQNNSVFILTVVLAVVFMLFVLAGYFVFRKRSWSEYYRTLRTWRSSKSINEQVNIYDQVEL